MTVKSIVKKPFRNSWGRCVENWALRCGFSAWLSLGLLICCLPSVAAQSPQQTEQQLPGQITGKVVDPSGVGLAGATVKLSRDDQSLDQQLQSDENGQFSFAGVPPGVFRISVIAEGFATQTYSGNLASGENQAIPQIVLAIATAVTQVRVVPSQIEIAEEQIKEQEKQRPLGFIPNFYVSYVPNAAPLTPKQKFKLAAKTVVDPVTFGLNAASAGIQQADDERGGYGQGAQGYAKRYGAAYADTVTSTLIGSAILPSLLKQDPRYFYKGTGSKRSRVLYALANSVICKSDSGQWQTNYSALIGSVASGGISNLYYPAADRGARLTFENALIGIGTTAAGNILQEFVIRKLTPNLPNHEQSNGDKLSGEIAKLLGTLARGGD